MSDRRTNPYINPGIEGSVDSAQAWDKGYQAALFNHPINLEDTDGIKAHQRGVKAGRALAAEEIGERLILLAQEYGHAQFVFTADDLEGLRIGVSELDAKLSNIQDLR